MFQTLICNHDHFMVLHQGCDDNGEHDKFTPNPQQEGLCFSKQQNQQEYRVSLSKCTAYSRICDNAEHRSVANKREVTACNPPGKSLPGLPADPRPIPQKSQKFCLLSQKSRKKNNTTSWSCLQAFYFFVGIVQKVFSEKASARTCVRNESKMRQNGSCFIGKSEKY